MKGSNGVTANDWVAYLTLLKQDWPKAPWCNMLRPRGIGFAFHRASIARGKQGLRLKAIKSNWAKARM